MIDKNKINNLVNEFVKDTNIFLVKLTLSKDNNIRIYIDGDEGVTIDDCVSISRYVESNLDREKEDFELNVSSSGLGQPFVLLRQYENSIGKKIQVTDTENKKIKGELKSVNTDGIKIQEELSSKYKKNKKTTLGEILFIPFESISEAKRIISL